MLNQQKFVLDLLTDFGYLDCKAATTPIVLNQNLNKAESDDILIDSIVI